MEAQKVTFFISENYEFKFDIKEYEDEVCLKDSNGFKFLSIRLYDDNGKIMDKEVAGVVLETLKPVIEEELGSAQEELYNPPDPFLIQKKLLQYLDKLETLEKQLIKADDELDVILIETQMNKLEELIFELKSQIDR